MLMSQGFFFTVYPVYDKDKAKHMSTHGSDFIKNNCKNFQISYTQKGSLTGIRTGMDGYIMYNSMIVELQI